MKHGWALGAALCGLALLPTEALACPMCFDASAENRMAFLMTAIALTALPLGMLSGVGLWLRRKFAQRESNDDLTVASVPADEAES